MATLDDLQMGIGQVLAGILFPGVAYEFGATATLEAPWQGQIGAPDLTLNAALILGQPTRAQENALIAASTAGLFVTNVAGMNRNTTRFLPWTQQITNNVPTLTATFTASEVVFGGTAGNGQVAGVTVNGVAYAYRMTSADTPASVAAAFAAQIPSALALGGVLTASTVQGAAVVADQYVLLHTGQQQQMVCLMALCPNAGGVGGALARAAVVRAVSGLKSMLRDDGSITRFIGLPDGSSARVMFNTEAVDDTPQNENVWRQWIYFLCEYDETITISAPSVLSVNVLMQGAGALVWCGPAPPAGSVLTDGQGDLLVDASGHLLGTF
jgi:hypothetical protein